MTYFTSTVLKSKEFENLKAKFSTLTHRNIPRSTSLDVLPGFNELKSLNKKAKIYQKEYENLVQKRNRPLNAEMLLEKETKKLQETLAVLEKENTRLNTSKLYLPKIGPTNGQKIIRNAGE